MSKIETWKITLALIGIIALGAALRLYRINFQSLWGDELYSIIPTEPKNSLASIIAYCRTDQPPFFFLYIHYFFKVFGYNELIGRLGCAFIGILGIPAIYFLAKECQSKSAGLFAALITAFNYFHLYFSQELRFYSMVFLLSALSYLYFIRAFKKPSLVNFTLYTVFTIGLLYTHYFGMLVFGAQALTFFVFLGYKRDPRFILYSLTAGILVIIAFVPWMPTVINDLGYSQPWLGTPSPFFVAEYFYDYTGIDVGSTIIFAVLIFLFLRSTIKKDPTINRSIYLTLIIWIVVSYLVPYIRSVAVTPMLMNKYTIITLPAWFLLISISWDKLKNEKWKLALTIMLPLSAMINLVFFNKHFTRIQKDQYREVSEIVISKNQLHYPVYSELPWHFNFYFRNNTDKVNGLTFVLENNRYMMDTKNIPQAQHLWLLQANLYPEDAQEQLNLFDGNFNVVERYDLYKAHAYLLVRK